MPQMEAQLRIKARTGAWLSLFVVAMPLVTGCTGGRAKDKIWIYQYPSFYAPRLKRIAVLPFGDRTRARGVGGRISDKVSAILTSNGTYEVYTRQHLRAVLTEQDLAASGIIDADVAKKIGRVGDVQALVCGICNRYETQTRNETRHNTVPVWGTNAQGHRVITGSRKVPFRWTRHDAFVECQVWVIDGVTGKQIAAVHSPSSYYAQGSPPKYAAPDLLRMAEEDQVGRIVRAIAVTRRQIELKGDVLKTATGLYDQKWDWQQRIAPGDKRFYVVVALPQVADRNNFKITIVPKGEREVLAETAFAWKKTYGRRGYGFRVKPIIDKRGFGAYQAKLYSGPEPIAWYDFQIVEAR